MKLFDRYSYKWIWPFIALLLVNVLAFVARGYALSQPLGAVDIGTFFLVSFLTGAAITFGGFLGYKAYFIAASLINLIAIAYMLIVSFGKTADGWSNLAGVASYFVIVGVGIVAGVAFQLLKTMIHKSKQSKA